MLPGSDLAFGESSVVKGEVDGDVIALDTCETGGSVAWFDSNFSDESSGLTGEADCSFANAGAAAAPCPTDCGANGRLPVAGIVNFTSAAGLGDVGVTDAIWIAAGFGAEDGRGSSAMLGETIDGTAGVVGLNDSSIAVSVASSSMISGSVSNSLAPADATGTIGAGSGLETTCAGFGSSAGGVALTAALAAGRGAATDTCAGVGEAGA